MQSFKLKFLGVTILQGVKFPIFLLIFEWALQQCSATALPVIVAWRRDKLRPECVTSYLQCSGHVTSVMFYVATDKDPSIDGGKFRSILGTIYNQSQLAERKHVARYCLINTVATSVPLSAHPSPLVITTKLAAAILVVAVVRRVRRRGSAGPVLPVCIGDGFWCVICLFEPERIGLKGKE